MCCESDILPAQAKFAEFAGIMNQASGNQAQEKADEAVNALPKVAIRLHGDEGWKRWMKGREETGERI